MMNQIVASEPYCIEDSVHLTRPGFESFLSFDGISDPTVVDKRQVKRQYRLQRLPSINTSLQLDDSNVGSDNQGYFESTLRKQIEQSSAQPIKAVYHAPTDVTNESLTRFSLGKSRSDPQYINPRQITTHRDHPSAITMLRHEQGPDHEIVPRYDDRLVLDRVLRTRLGPGGTLNPEEDCEQAENYLRSQYSFYLEPSFSSSPRQPSNINQNLSRRDELARQYMYTSVQQASYSDVPWDSKLPPKLSIPLTSLEPYGLGPNFRPKRRSILHDIRTSRVLEWDRTQPRDNYFNRKPFNNVAPLPRAQQIPGYSGSISGSNIQDIDNPDISFEPFAVVRTEQPKFAGTPRKANSSFYTGKTHWTKVDPVSHYDKFGNGYTTTAEFHKSLPLDYSSPRYSDLNGSLSRIVTTVMPQNPFNQMDNMSKTVNASLDSRPFAVLRSLPGKKLTPMKDSLMIEEQNVNKPVST